VPLPPPPLLLLLLQSRRDIGRLQCEEKITVIRADHQETLSLVLIVATNKADHTKLRN
jgi:hypothetical protein